MYIRIKRNIQEKRNTGKMIEKVFLGLVMSLFLFLTPALPLVFLVGFFIMADTIMGLYKSWYLKEPILSRKLARLITKFIAYTGSILLVYSLDVLILGDFINNGLLITKVAAGVLAFIEVFSIDENLRLINNNKGIIFYVKRFLSSFKLLKEKLGDFIDIDKKV